MAVEVKNSKGERIFTCPGDSLVGADFRGANLKDAVLQDMDCSGAIFDNVSLENAHCRGTNFNGASFKNVDMLRGQFHAATFREADFEGVDMERAIFFNADLTGAKNWDKRARSYQAKFSGATMPDGRKAE